MTCVVGLASEGAASYQVLLTHGSMTCVLVGLLDKSVPDKKLMSCEMVSHITFTKTRVVRTGVDTRRSRKSRCAGGRGRDSGARGRGNRRKEAR